MITHLVSIGNSKGIRIPKSILESCGFEKDVEITIKKDFVILRPIQQVRKDWDESFHKMAQKQDDHLLLEDTHNWDDEEWEWS